MDIVRSAVGGLTWLLSFVPDFLRPSLFIAIIVCLFWLLFGRLWLLRLICGLGVIMFAVVGAFASLMLYVEYLTTRGRRGSTGPAPPGSYTFGAHWENVLSSATTSAQKLRKRTWRPHGWPVKTILVVALLGLPVWVLGALNPPLTTNQGAIGRAYGHWAALEVWSGLNPDRQTMVARQPPSTVVIKGDRILVSLSPSFTNTDVAVHAVKGGLSSKSPAVSLKTNKEGDAAKKVDSRFVRTYRRGQVVELRYAIHRELVRIA